MARKKLAVKRTAVTKPAGVAPPAGVPQITLNDVAAALEQLEMSLAQVRQVVHEFARNSRQTLDCPLPQERRMVPKRVAMFCRNCTLVAHKAPR